MNAAISRRRKPFSDLRFLIGIVLVIASVTGVWFIVQSTRETTPVLQANRTIVQGEALGSADFHVVEVVLGAAEDSYLTPADLETDFVAARTIEAGELLPRAAITTSDATGRTTIVVDSSIPLSESLRPGMTVELWFAAPTGEANTYEKPAVLVPTAVVAAIAEDNGIVGTNSTAVELVVHRDDVAAILAALADGSILSVIPAGAQL